MGVLYEDLGQRIMDGFFGSIGLYNQFDFSDGGRKKMYIDYKGSIQSPFRPHFLSNQLRCSLFGSMCF